MAFNKINQRLNGLNPLSYLGENAYQPSEFVTNTSDPTANDSQNFALGTFWLNTNTNALWYLASLASGIATWIKISSGTGNTETLTGNSGGPISPDGSFNINVVGDGTTINAVGNPATHTITFSAVGTGLVTSLETQDSHVVTPTGGVIQLSGSGVLHTTGTVGPNTATINLTNGTNGQLLIGGGANAAWASLTSTGGTITFTPGANSLNLEAAAAVSDSFVTDSGTATPVAHVLDIKAGVSTQNSGSSVEFTGATNVVLLNVTDSLGNTIIGKGSGNASLTGTNNTILGKASGAAFTTAASNVVVGEGALAASLTGANNVIIGTGAGSAYTTSEYSNVIIGNGVPGVATELGVIRIGNAAEGYDNIFIGFNSGANASQVIGTANDNVCLGSSTLSLLTDGGGNSAFGAIALAALTSGDGNMAIGNACLTTLTNGDSNSCIGWHSMDQLITGDYNASLGYESGHNCTGAESSNIFINNIGVMGDNNTCRIGATTGTGTQQLNKTFIAGIAGVTTTVNDAVAVLISVSTGQLGTVSSSLRYKENVQDMDSYSNRLMKLRPVIFNYKKDERAHVQYGLIAEEVDQIFPELVVYHNDQPESVRYHELPTILLNELIKLSNRVKELEDKLKS